jgi:hypothetical protein
MIAIQGSMSTSIDRHDWAGEASESIAGANFSASKENGNG